MNNTLKINLNSLREEGMKELFDALENACKSLNIDFYMIGAMAREIWFSREGKSYRSTKDIDFAVYISQEVQYTKLKEYLITEYGFRENRGNSFVLISPKHIQIDLLPFGAIEVENGVQISGQGLSNIRVTGFKEVYEEATNAVKLETDHEFKVATLPGIVLLKFIAYDDRPEHRSSDIRDIINIIKHFFELESELIFNQHNDLFQEKEDLIPEYVSARVIGREMSKALNKSEKLLKRIIYILSDSIKNDSSSIPLLIAEKNNYTVEDSKNFLKEILRGIEERT